MKKLLTLPNILKACAAVLGLVAFFVMFANQLYAEILGSKGYVEFSDALFGEYGAGISFVGYLLVLLGALGICALVLLKLDDKMRRMCVISLAGLLVLGAVFIFIEAAVYNGKVGSNIYHLAAAPIFAGIFALLAACSGCASEFLK